MDYFEEILKKQFLISELQRFYRENGKSPMVKDMNIKNGYPSAGAYTNHFGLFNNALKIAGLEINHYQHKLDGTETCSYCGKYANEIIGFVSWIYPNGIRYCHKHGQNGRPDYVKGTLDINTPTGRGRAGEITVVKALKIGTEHDCARLSCGHPFDLYHKEEYKKINVKTSVFSNDYNSWMFNFNAQKIADTYICIAMSSDTKQVERVWIVPNINEIRDLTGFQIYNGNLSLKNNKHWKVNPKIYDDAWQDMLLNYTDGKCGVYSKKGK